MSDQAFDRNALATRLGTIVGAEHVIRDEPLSAHTTFEVGGPAALFVMPGNADELSAVLEACREAAAPHFVLGCGSDLLVADKGYPGVIVSLTERLTHMEAHDNVLVCEAGVSLKNAAAKACELGLGGLEFACGIPGSVGGACFMNAGAYDGCIADVLQAVNVLLADGSLATIGVDDLALGYRKSRIADEGMVVISAAFGLTPTDRPQIQAKMDDLTRRREEKQPLELPSAGSTFKRPEGYFAGKLISDAGLKGWRSGGAAVSEKHAGFVVNVGGASAADVHAVIEHVQDEVERQFGVRLQPEVRFLG